MTLEQLRRTTNGRKRDEIQELVEVGSFRKKIEMVPMPRTAK
jgi:hypothetical protein